MSSSIYDTESAAPIQGVSWNEEDWQGMLKRLPSQWQEQAVKLKAWQRVRKLAQVSDLLRALLVYAACGYSFRQLGLWATLVGVGCLSERAWRKRVERAQGWSAWLLGAVIGSQASPGWLPGSADASCCWMPVVSRFQQEAEKTCACIAPMICKRVAWCR